jgi:AcrR family transcriptional regulator
MAREYVQRARAESAATTRRRMVEAARAVLMDGEVPRLELAEVAQRAGIARSTVYLSFGTRSALMTAILDDSLNRAGFERVREYLALPDAIEAMEKTLAQAAAMYAADYAVLGRTLLLARLDPDAARDYGARQERRAAGMRDLARRLGDQQRLRAGVSVDEASAVLWVLTSFETFDQLFSGWSLDARTCGTRIVAMARSSLL